MGAEKIFDFRLKIIEKSDDEQLVFGWLYQCEDRVGKQIVDHSGEVVAVHELEKASYGFALESRKAGEMHRKTEGVGRLCEIIVTTREKQKAMGLPDGALPIGIWVGFKVDDREVWQKIKSGEYSMLSFGGRAIKEEI